MKPRQVQERLADKNLQALLVNHFKAQYQRVGHNITDINDRA
jgi:hypothetical protein